MGEFPHILASFPCPWTLWIPRLNVKVDYITVRWWRLSTFKGTFSCGPQMPVHSHSFFWKSILAEQLKKKVIFILENESFYFSNRAVTPWCYYTYKALLSMSLYLLGSSKRLSRPLCSTWITKVYPAGQDVYRKTK